MPKSQAWLTRKKFAELYVKKWKLEKTPSIPTLRRWFDDVFAPKKLARLVDNPFVASGSNWEVSPKALDIPPPKAGPKFKEKKTAKAR